MDAPVLPSRGLVRCARRRLAPPVALRGKVIGGLPPDGGGRIAGDACAL